MCSVNNRFPPCVRLSPSPSLHSQNKLMTDSPITHCNFTLNLRGTNSTEHPKNSVPFFSLFHGSSLFSSLYLTLFFYSYLTSPAPRFLFSLCFGGLCKSINKITQTNDPVPTSFSSCCLFLTLFFISEA